MPDRTFECHSPENWSDKVFVLPTANPPVYIEEGLNGYGELIKDTSPLIALPIISINDNGKPDWTSAVASVEGVFKGMGVQWRIVKIIDEDGVDVWQMKLYSPDASLPLSVIATCNIVFEHWQK